MSVRFYAVVVSCFLCMVAGISADVLAQSFGGTGGTTGGSTGTSGLSGGTGFSGLSGNSSFGTSSPTSTGTTGTTGTGSSTGTTGTAAGTGTTNTSAQQFIGGNAAEAFVGGARQGGQTSSGRQFQAFQNTQMQSNTQQTTGTPRQIRTTMSIGFNFPAASTAQVSGKLAAPNAITMDRFAVSRPELSGISVNLTSDGTAILTGSSPNEESVRLAGNLMRLQPGVRRIDNQIAVSP